MDDKDRQFIESLLVKQTEQFQHDIDQKLAKQSEQFQHDIDQKLAKQTEQFQQHLGVVEENFDHKLVQQTEQFQNYLGIIAENFDNKLAIIAEGHQMLADKIDRVESSLSVKIDKIAYDVAAHRADTEAHYGIYRVMEDAITA